MPEYTRYREPRVGEPVQYTDHDGTLRAALIMGVDVLGSPIRSTETRDLVPLLTLGVLQPPQNSGGLWVEYVQKVPHCHEPTQPFSWRYTEEGVAAL